MFIVVLIVLTILTIGVFDRSGIVGVVLGGLLWMVWFLHSKLNIVNQQFKDLEAKLSKLQGATIKADAKTSSDNETLVSDIQPPKPLADDVIQADKPATANASFMDDSGFEIELDSNPETTRAEQKSEAYEDLRTPANTTIGLQEETDKNAQQSLYRGVETVATVTKKHSEEHSGTQESVAARETSQTPRPPKAPTGPREPNIVEKLMSAGWNWVTDGNVFVRVGIIVLFMGMTFLTRYAIGQNLIPIELRLAAISAVALGLLFWGWRQREAKRSFSLVVQGGGIGLLYLTIFAGFSLYDVIPSTLAFILLALVVVLAAVIAVTQDAKPIALFATIGGFLAPILTSSGSNNYVGLFSYYTLLNLGIFSVAWFKSWRILNFTGFIFTFLISTVWGVLSYQKEFFSNTEPFLIVFFLLYVAIGILFAHKRTPFYKNYVDSSLIFGTPIFAFGLQCAMVKDYEYGVAISAVVLGVFYLILTSVLWKKYGERLRLLSETFLSLGVIFTTLAIPFAIDGYLSGAAWAIEGAGILWVSIKQEQKYRRYFGTALVFAAGPMLIYGLQTAETVSPFFNSFFIGCVIITIAATLASWLLSKDFEGKTKIEKSLSNALLLYAIAALLGGFETEIVDFELFAVHGSLLALLSGITIIIYTLLAERLDWQKGNWVSVGFVMPLGTAALLSAVNQSQLSNYFGYLLWPATWIACFYGFKKAISVIDHKALHMAHMIAASAIIGLLLWDGIWQLMLGYSVLAIVFNHLSKRFEWPQLKPLALGFFPVLVLCSLLAISTDGDLITLSNIAGTARPPFPPGVLLWPFSFVVYFYLVFQNKDFGGNRNKYFHYAGATLIGALLLWLGLGPLMLGASLLAVLFSSLWQKFDWPEMRVISMALLPVMLLTTAITLLDGGFHITKLDGLSGLSFISSVETGYYLWPLSFIAMFWTFRKYDNLGQPAPAILHAAGAILFSFILTWEASWHLLDHFELLNAWHMAWLPIVSMAMISIILRAKSWPFAQHKEAYQQRALPLLVLIPIGWSFLQLMSSGDSTPLPWIPIFNPIDIVQIIILMGAFFWGHKLIPNTLKRFSSKQIFYGIVGFGFIWANVELLRGVHHWVGIAWQLPTIVSTNVSQTVIALFWALSGLLVTVFASKRHDRTLWFFGGALLVAVVLKLFLVDLSAQGTIERIISFTGVGLLLVAVGYFSPLPPKEPSEILPTQDDANLEEKADV